MLTLIVNLLQLLGIIWIIIFIYISLYTLLNFRKYYLSEKALNIFNKKTVYEMSDEDKTLCAYVVLSASLKRQKENENNGK